MKFEHFPLKSIQIDCMQSENVLYIEKIKYSVVWKREIDIAYIILKYVPIRVFVEFKIRHICILA